MSRCLPASTCLMGPQCRHSLVDKPHASHDAAESRRSRGKLKSAWTGRGKTVMTLAPCQCPVHEGQLSQLWRFGCATKTLSRAASMLRQKEVIAAALCLAESAEGTWVPFRSAPDKSTCQALHDIMKECNASCRQDSTAGHIASTVPCRHEPCDHAAHHGAPAR